MSRSSATSWLTGNEVKGFGLPRGRLARLMGALMSRGNDLEQTDVLGLLEPRDGEHVVEVGYGPGTLVSALVAGGCSVSGVDPSEPMCAMATRRNAAAVAAGQVSLAVGTAEATGLPDRSADAVVAVNNVVFWSDLRGGFGELRRVLRPAGRLVVSWHGGTRPTRMAARMALADDALDRVLQAARDEFGQAQRHDLPHVVAFTARR